MSTATRSALKNEDVAGPRTRHLRWHLPRERRPSQEVVTWQESSPIPLGALACPTQSSTPDLQVRLWRRWSELCLLSESEGSEAEGVQVGVEPGSGLQPCWMVRNRASSARACGLACRKNSFGEFKEVGEVAAPRRHGLRPRHLVVRARVRAEAWKCSP